MPSVPEQDGFANCGCLAGQGLFHSPEAQQTWGSANYGVETVTKWAAQAYLIPFTLGIGSVGEGVGSLGLEAGTEAAVAEASTETVTVTSWASEGITPDLNPGRWVMKGGPTWANYIKTGLWGPQFEPGVGFFTSEVPFANSITGEIEETSLRWPSGWEFVKGLLGQRVIIP